MGRQIFEGSVTNIFRDFVTGNIVLFPVRRRNVVPNFVFVQCGSIQKTLLKVAFFVYPVFILYYLELKWLPVGLHTCLINKISQEIASSESEKLAKF